MPEVAFDTNVHAALCLARIGGAPVAEVALLADDLTLGPIDDLSPTARERVRRRYSSFPAPQFAGECAAFSERVRTAKRIRIWSSGRPYERAGTLFACSLASADAHVSIADYERGGLLVKGIIDEHRFENAAAAERPLNQGRAAARWKKLVREDASLRIVQDGEVVSASEETFDDTVRDMVRSAPSNSDEYTPLLISRACAERAGGLIATDFFLGRMRALGLDRAENR